MAIKARAALERIEPYVPGMSLEELMALRGIDDVVKLASNENPLGPSPLAQEAIARAAADAHYYPDGGSERLRDRLAEELGLRRDNVIAGCGSDEIIRMLAEAYLDPGDVAVFADVTFSQYAFATRLMGGREAAVPLLDDGRHDLPAMAEAARERRARLCFVCNPNNPTGTYVTQQEMQRFLELVPEDTLVVFDEAYIEYATAPDFPDVVAELRGGRSLVSLRTFSKIHALAGLRVGYGLAPKDVIDALERVRPPFNVNRIAQAAALASLDDKERLEASASINARQRQRLTADMTALGLDVLPSEANFVFVDVGSPCDPIYESLLDQGIIVRKGTPFGRPNALRITCGTQKQNDALMAALERALEASRQVERRQQQ